MQPLRTTIICSTPKRLPLTPKAKPTIRRHFTTTPHVANMSLFPRFTQEFAPLFRLMDDYDNRAFRNLDQHLLSEARSFTPKFDVRELANAYELHGEFPGVEQKDISIEWTDANTLTVKGRHERVREEGEKPQTSSGAIEDGEHYAKPSVEDEGAESTTSSNTQVTKQNNAQDVAKKSDTSSTQPRYWVSERSVGEFHRSFSFPSRVDQDAVKASLKNGILSVVVPKAKAPVPRRISIE